MKTPRVPRLSHVRRPVRIAIGVTLTTLAVELAAVEAKGSGRTLVRCRNTAYADGALDKPLMVAESLAMVIA